MGALMRSTDWSKTSIGAIESWSPALRMMVRLLLANRFPLLLWWGPRYCQLYNDPYRPVLGDKHPTSMGQPARECFSEIWDVIGPLIDTPFNGGSATWMDDLQLEYIRYDRLEEAHFTVAYSPVPDETVPSGIGGVLATVHEITEQVVGERRLSALRDLGSRSGEAKTTEEACVIAARTLAQHPEDVPFALLYLLNGDRTQAHLASAAGIEMGRAESPLEIALSGKRSREAIWPLAETVRSEAMQIVEDLQGKLSSVPAGPWADPPRLAVVWPMRSNIAHQLAGLLVLGLSSRLQFDDRYRDFCELVASQVATAIANARAHEEERKRAEALAEIDRAKTVFFSNVSHEFRTPLTLMLGPLEEELRENSKGRERLEIAHRNSLRLLKLVNTLLDFARIEAGRIEVVYEPIDLAAATVELASVFRSAMGKPVYRQAQRLLITADSGGSNGSRVRLWKLELQQFADETGLHISACHLPPGTSKWNKIEHRLFSFISQNWRGKPLVSHEVIVNLISATTTQTGLKVRAKLDTNSYPPGAKVSKKQIAEINIHPDSFHGEWNYTIRPNI